MYIGNTTAYSIRPSTVGGLGHFIYNSVLRKNAKNSRLTKPLSSSKIISKEKWVFCRVRSL